MGGGGSIAGMILSMKNNRKLVKSRTSVFDKKKRTAINRSQTQQFETRKLTQEEKAVYKHRNKMELGIDGLLLGIVYTIILIVVGWLLLVFFFL